MPTETKTQRRLICEGWVENPDLAIDESVVNSLSMQPCVIYVRQGKKVHFFCGKPDQIHESLEDDTVIVESLDQLECTLNEDGRKVVDGDWTFEGVFQRCDVKNANGRVYSRRLWERVLGEGASAVKAIVERSMVGHLEHPKDGRTDGTLGAIITTEAVLKPDGTVWGKGKILDTPHGKILKAYTAEGVRWGVSSRGSGVIRADGNVDESDYQLVAWDAVMRPSVPGAFPQVRPAAESVQKMTLAGLVEQQVDEVWVDKSRASKLHDIAAMSVRQALREHHHFSNDVKRDAHRDDHTTIHLDTGSHDEVRRGLESEGWQHIHNSRAPDKWARRPKPEAWADHVATFIHMGHHGVTAKAIRNVAGHPRGTGPQGKLSVVIDGPGGHNLESVPTDTTTLLKAINEPVDESTANLPILRKYLKYFNSLNHHVSSGAIPMKEAQPAYQALAAKIEQVAPDGMIQEDFLLDEADTDSTFKSHKSAALNVQTNLGRLHHSTHTSLVGNKASSNVYAKSAAKGEIPALLRQGGWKNKPVGVSGTDLPRENFYHPSYPHAEAVYHPSKRHGGDAGGPANGGAYVVVRSHIKYDGIPDSAYASLESLSTTDQSPLYDPPSMDATVRRHAFKRVVEKLRHEAVSAAKRLHESEQREAELQEQSVSQINEARKHTLFLESELAQARSSLQAAQTYIAESSTEVTGPVQKKVRAIIESRPELEQFRDVLEDAQSLERVDKLVERLGNVPKNSGNELPVNEDRRSLPKGNVMSESDVQPQVERAPISPNVKSARAILAHLSPIKRK